MYRTLHNEREGSMSQTSRGVRLVDHADGAKWKAVKWKVPWRTTHVLISILTIVAGFATFLPLGYVNKYFFQHCVLYADIRFSWIQHNSTAVVSFPLSVWGEKIKCHFTTFSPVVASIHAFVWGWFFLLMRSAFSRKHQEFSLMFPSFLFHSIVLIVVFVSSCYINEGIDVWCKNFDREINSKNTGRRMTCSDSQTINWDIFTQKNRFYTFLSTARVATWFLTVCVLLQCIACVYHMYSGIMQDGTDTNKAGNVNSAYVGPPTSGQLPVDKKSINQNGAGGARVTRRVISASPDNL